MMSKHFNYLNSTVCAFSNSLGNIHVYIENICLWKKSATYFSHMITNFTISNLEITVHHEYSGLFEYYYNRVVCVRMISGSPKPTFEEITHNPRNLNPRNFQILVSFSFKTIFPLSPSVTTLVSKDGKFFAHPFVYVNSLPEDAHLLKRLRKIWKVDFRCSVPRKLVQVRYHGKWFFKLYNLSYSDSSFIFWVENPGIQPNYELTKAHFWRNNT